MKSTQEMILNRAFCYHEQNTKATMSSHPCLHSVQILADNQMDSQHIHLSHVLIEISKKGMFLNKDIK